MTSISRWALGAFAAFLLIAAPVGAAAPSQPWAHLKSDLPADPSVIFGTLPNGMRYAIRRNTTPKGAVSLRLRIDAGSLMERDNEQGIAHMLEHMAFRGSRNVADGDTVKKLQSLGLTFGADTNAFTYPTQTVYSFDMPKNDETSVDTAFVLLRDIASNLDIKQEALNTERNVVLAEARLRDVPISHLRKSDYQFLYGDRAADALTPIGKENIIANSTSALLRGFYDAWYRPERATLLIVGDVDPKAIEAKLIAKFSDWKGRGLARTPAKYVPPAKRPSPVKLFVENGAQTYIIFNWVSPFDASHDTRAIEARDVIRYIGMAVVNQRLAQLAHGANPPFISAQLTRNSTANIADVTELFVTYRPGEGVEGLKAAQRIWRDAYTNGVQQVEVDQVIAQLRTFFEGNAAATDTTPTTQVMDALLRSVDENNVFTSPEADVELYEAVVKGLTAGRVSAALREVLSGAGPLVFASSASTMPGGEQAVIDALADADKNPTSTANGAAAPPWPYGDFGKPGKVASQRTVDDLGVTYIRFENGVTLTVKPTQFKVGQILMNVRFGTGRLGLSRDSITPAWALSGFFVQGGLRQYSIDDLQRYMADKLWGAQLGVGDDEFTLSGQARASDLKAELQVLAAYVTDPAWNENAFDQVRTASAGVYDQVETSPSGLLSREFYGRLHNNDPRWRSPTKAEIAASTVDQAKAILAKALADGPLDITMAGDVTVDQAIEAVASTFGALPRRPAWTDVTGDERFPPGTQRPLVLGHTGAENQAVAAIAWPTTGFFHDMKLQRTLRVLGEIFSQRLLDELRTREGITYTPGASSSSSIVSPDYGFLYALAQIPPDKIEVFYTQVANVVNDLKDKPVTQDELDRARGPRIQDIQKQQQTNDYWLSLLSGSAANPRLLDVIRTTVPDLESVTIADVQKAAKEWLDNDKAFTLVVAPKVMVDAQTVR